MEQLNAVLRAVEDGGWDYAEAAREASKYGGMTNFLENMCDDCIKYGKKTGRTEMIPALAMTFILGMIWQIVKEPLTEAVKNKLSQLKEQYDYSTEVMLEEI